MYAKRITVCISPAIGERLKRRARMNECSHSEVVRRALENYLGSISTRRTAYDLAVAAGLIGRLRGAPADLSSNRKYFNGFGKRGPP